MVFTTDWPPEPDELLLPELPELLAAAAQAASVEASIDEELALPIRPLFGLPTDAPPPLVQPAHASPVIVIAAPD
ncbi:MAG: hypothetical protein JF571_07235 [Asticcacaulis sp.]|nr:hypothetical protein [Asticcacaulis sp.]